MIMKLTQILIGGPSIKHLLPLLFPYEDILSYQGIGTCRICHSITTYTMEQCKTQTESGATK